MAFRARFSPWLFVLTSAVWFAVGGGFGLLLPALQLVGEAGGFFRLYQVALTGHGVALTFGGLFQLMVGLSLLLAGTGMGGGRPADTPLGWPLYGLLNGSLTLLAAADLMGFVPSYVLMYPLPLEGVRLGLWSQSSLVLALVGLAGLLLAVLFVYPAVLTRALFGKIRPARGQLGELLRDPGMLGMALYAVLMPLLGLPLVAAALGVFLAVIGLAERPVGALPFNLAFWLFAHNLMEAMGVMALGLVYRLVPLYLADGSCRLYSPRLGVAALLLYSASAIPAFGHHLYTMVSSQPLAFQSGAQAASWLTGFAAAFTAFNVGATLWKHGLRAEPAVLLVLGGFGVYLADGFVALQLSTQTWNLRLHGTLYVTAHTMTILVALGLIWLGALHHQLARINRPVSSALACAHGALTLVSALGMFYAMLGAGAQGLPRRAYLWPPEAATLAGVLLLFGLVFAAAQAILGVGILARLRTRAG